MTGNFALAFSGQTSAKIRNGGLMHRVRRATWSPISRTDKSLDFLRGGRINLTEDDAEPFRTGLVGPKTTVVGTECARRNIVLYK